MTRLACFLAFSIAICSSTLSNAQDSSTQAPAHVHSDTEAADAQMHPHNDRKAMNEVARIQGELNLTKDTNKALDKLQDLLKREPNNVEAHMMCGKVLQLMGYESLADEQYRLVDKLDPSQPTSTLAAFQNKLASGGPLAAYEYLQYVQRRFPKDPSVLLMQGMMERMHGQDTKAEFYYREALDKNPNTQGLATAMSALRLSQKRYQDAIKYAERDIKLKKDHPAANLAKGEALIGMGQYAEAVPFLRIAFEGVADKRSVSDVLSRALISDGQYGAAIEPTLVCLSLTKMKEKKTVDQLKSRLAFILARVDSSELMNSLEIARRKMTYQETMANLYFASGDVLDKAGYDLEAAECFEKGLKLYPYSGRPFMRLGILQERRGDYQAALKNYERAYQLSPDDREVAARCVRLIKRIPIQKDDLAWMIKDLMRGGRKTQFYLNQ